MSAVFYQARCFKIKITNDPQTETIFRYYRDGSFGDAKTDVKPACVVM